MHENIKLLGIKMNNPLKKHFMKDMGKVLLFLKNKMNENIKVLLIEMNHTS